MLPYLTQGPPPPPGGPPPAPLVPGLNNVPALIFTLAMWATAFVCIYLAQFKGVNFPIRRVEALDVIDESVGRAVEMGKDVCLHAAGLQPQTDIGVSVLSITHYIGRLCAKTNAKLQVWLQANAIQSGILIEDNLRQAYTLEGEEFNRDEVMRYEGIGSAHNMLLVSYLYSDQPAAYLTFGKQIPMVRQAEELNRAGVLSIVGGVQANSWERSVFYDYALLGEEVIAAGAYLSRIRNLIASIVSSDIIQYGLMILVVVLAVGELLGLGLASEVVNFWQGQT